MFFGSVRPRLTRIPATVSLAVPRSHNTYVCGNKGYCDQYPDNEFCLGRQRRTATPPHPADTTAYCTKPDGGGEVCH
jgi:hypothetical protein